MINVYRLLVCFFALGILISGATLETVTPFFLCLFLVLDEKLSKLLEKK